MTIFALRGILLLLFFCSGSAKSVANRKRKRDAVVSLVAGESSGYDGGAIALGQSLKDVGSKLHRVLLVDKEVRLVYIIVLVTQAAGLNPHYRWIMLDVLLLVTFGKSLKLTRFLATISCTLRSLAQRTISVAPGIKLG